MNSQPPDRFRQALCNIEVEQALLSMILRDNAEMARISALRPEHFFDPLHARIFAAITTMVKSGKCANAMTMYATMASDPGILTVHGPDGEDYLALLALPPRDSSRIEDLAEIIIGHAQRRALIQIGEDIIQAAYDPANEKALASQIVEAQAAIAREASAARLGWNGSATFCGPAIHSSAEFVAGFAPPDYVIDGIVQRHRVYSNTGVTGCGKTAVLLRLLATTALGRDVGGHGVAKGRCLMLVGENPDDVRGRWIALAEQMGFFPDEIDVHFMPGVFAIDSLTPLMQQKAMELGGLALVGVDTGAAFFDGDDENDNKAMGDYARRLRTLSDVPGLPGVIVNCHPVKNATDENLAPRGGGAFLNEMDGNLTSKRKGEASVELHWQHKFRGPDFVPITFDLVTVTSTKLVDSKGRPLPTVYAKPISEIELASHEALAGREKRALITTMAANPGASVAELAAKAGWVSVQGKPAKSKVHRLLHALKAQRLVAMELENWVLTSTGERAAKKFQEAEK